MLSLVLFILSSRMGFHLSSFEIDGAPGDTFFKIKVTNATATNNNEIIIFKRLQIVYTF